MHRDDMPIEERLRHCGLRPTRQRIALADLLFAKGDRHLTVEELHEEAVTAGVPVSNLEIGNLPEPPEGMEIAHVDVVIRLRRKRDR